MSPFVEGQFFGEVERSGLPSLRLDVLLDTVDIPLIRSVSVLRNYLADVRPFLSINIHVATCAYSEKADALRLVWLFEWAPLPTDVPAAVVKELGTSSQQLQRLVGAALEIDADLVCSASPLREEEVWSVDALHTQLGSPDLALRTCETFVRGHDIAWAFSDPVWNGTFSTLYPQSEPEFKILSPLGSALFEAQKTDKSLEPASEFARRLGYNTLFNLAYTRDKLLFYIQQRKRAKREGRIRQHFTMEIGYFLNHYYLLLWNGVDQLCWLLNFVFKLGFDPKDPSQEKAVGVTRRFTDRLAEVNAEVAELFRDSDFLKWRRILMAARHYAAHQGAVIPSEMYIRPDPDITDEELDKEIDAEGELNSFRGLATPRLIEIFRSTIRIRKRQEKYKKVGDILMLEEGGKYFYIFPLRHTMWDFNQFFSFARKVVDLCSARLEGEAKVATKDSP